MGGFFFLLINYSCFVWVVVYILFFLFGLGIGSEIWDFFGLFQLGNDLSSLDVNVIEVQCYCDFNWDYWWYIECMLFDWEV